MRYRRGNRFGEALSFWLGYWGLHDPYKSAKMVHILGRRFQMKVGVYRDSSGVLHFSEKDPQVQGWTLIGHMTLNLDMTVLHNETPEAKTS